MWSNLKSMAHDDETLYDLAKGMPDDYEPPEYPSGLQFSLTQADLKSAGIDASPGDSGRFSAMAEVTSTYEAADDCRIELQVGQFAGEDGRFIDLEPSAHLCLRSAELERMGLAPDCERGDTIHLIGTARLENLSSSEFGGDMATLQVTELSYEDESAEARG